MDTGFSHLFCFKKSTIYLKDYLFGTRKKMLNALALTTNVKSKSVSHCSFFLDDWKYVDNSNICSNKKQKV